MISLWGQEFEIKKPDVKKIIKKTKNPASNSVITKSKNSKLSLKDKIQVIVDNVYKILGKYRDNTIVITDKNQFSEYIDKAIQNGVIAIDTETNNSLDPFTCLLMGACIYTPNLKQAYIPINHVNVDTREKLSNQLTEQDIKEQFSRLSNTKIIMHNAQFDYLVLKCTCGISLKVYWDTMIGARLLNENEHSYQLKDQYKNKINSEEEKYSIEHLFEKQEYAIFSPEVFALYAATDAYKTYMLCEWQLEQFEKPDNYKIKQLMLNVEMPVSEVAAEMQYNGIQIDTEYAQRLSRKYHKKLEKVEAQLQQILEKNKPIINEWRLTEEANYKPISNKANKNGEYKFQKSKNEQLSDPPDLSSPLQLAILLYDIFKLSPANNSKTRSTDEEALKNLNHPLCKIMLQKRELDKLLNTYIDKIPECISIKDNRLHAHFNSLEAKTGRFSSSQPNLQNIPASNKEIRMMFTAKENHVLIGSDFSLLKVG